MGFNNRLSYCKIGKFCSLGSNIITLSGTHPTRNWVSTSPAFHSESLKKNGLYYEGYINFSTLKKTKNNFSIEIGNDVWIGDNVIFISGIKIGNGVIIGAGSVVTKDVQPYSVVVGVPAKEIRKRFSEEEIKFLEKLKWWNKDESWIKKNVKNFSDIKLFINELKNEKGVTE